jgi:hypothetical protein
MEETVVLLYEFMAYFVAAAGWNWLDSCKD